RGGLKPGKKAPAFTLPTVAGPEVSLADYASRQVLLVFVQTACGPCRAIAPALNRLHDSGHVAVLAVNKGETEPTRKWAAEAHIRFPVAMQEGVGVSKRYEVFATPFAFLIDAHGVIASKGLVSNEKQIDFVLERRRDEGQAVPVEAETGQAGADQLSESDS